MAVSARFKNYYKLVISLVFVLLFLVVSLFVFFKISPKLDSAKEIYNSTEVQSEIETKLIENNLNIQTDSSIETILQEKIELAVPLIKQENSLTCEVTSLQMVLKYYGIESSQSDLLDQIGFSEPLQPFFIGDKMYWGDPDIGFVGDPNGEVYDQKQGLNGATGFGVNSGPILKLLKKYLPRSTQVVKGNIDYINQSLEAGNPVIFWHVPNSNLYMGKKTYQTQSGKEVTLLGEHVNVVIGKYIQNNQSIYILNDPLYGRLEKTQVEMEKIWSAYNNMAISVKK